MRIFITGGTGFIGTHLVRLLSKTQHDLHCLVRKTSDVRTLEKARAKLISGDVTDKQSLLRGMHGCDWVINLANLFEFWVPDRHMYAKVNIDGTNSVMEAALQTGVSKVVHVSTAAVYGNADWPVTEESPLGPACASEYAQTKRAGDLLAWKLYQQERLPLVMIYPGAVVGPNDPKAAGRYIQNLTRGRMPAQVLRKRVFAWVCVGDVAAGIVKALEKQGNIGEKYLLTAENLTFGEINSIVCEISGARLPRLALPDSLTVFASYLLTGLANLMKRPPMWDLSVDQIRSMKQGLQVDGSKAARELGLAYTPIRVALKEAIQALCAEAPPDGALYLQR